MLTTDIIKHKIAMELEVVGVIDTMGDNYILSNDDYKVMLDRSDRYAGTLLFNTQGLNIKQTGLKLESVLNYDINFEKSSCQYYGTGMSDANEFFGDSNELIDVISTPLAIVFTIMMLAATYMIISSNIEAKSKSWMIMRAESARYTAVLGIVTWQHVILVVSQILLGILLAVLGCVGLNYMLLPIFVKIYGNFFLINLPEVLSLIALIVVTSFSTIVTLTALLFRKKISKAITDNK